MDNYQKYKRAVRNGFWRPFSFWVLIYGGICALLTILLVRLGQDAHVPWLYAGLAVCVWEARHQLLKVNPEARRARKDLETEMEDKFQAQLWNDDQPKYEVPISAFTMQQALSRLEIADDSELIHLTVRRVTPSDN